MHAASRSSTWRSTCSDVPGITAASMNDIADAGGRHQAGAVPALRLQERPVLGARSTRSAAAHAALDHEGDRRRGRRARADHPRIPAYFRWVADRHDEFMLLFGGSARHAEEFGAQIRGITDEAAAAIAAVDRSRHRSRAPRHARHALVGLAEGRQPAPGRTRASSSIPTRSPRSECPGMGGLRAVQRPSPRARPSARTALHGSRLNCRSRHGPATDHRAMSSSVVRSPRVGLIVVALAPARPRRHLDTPDIVRDLATTALISWSRRANCSTSPPSGPSTASSPMRVVAERHRRPGERRAAAARPARRRSHERHRAAMAPLPSPGSPSASAAAAPIGRLRRCDRRPGAHRRHTEALTPSPERRRRRDVVRAAGGRRRGTAGARTGRSRQHAAPQRRRRGPGCDGVERRPDGRRQPPPARPRHRRPGRRDRPDRRDHGRRRSLQAAQRHVRSPGRRRRAACRRHRARRPTFVTTTSCTGTAARSSASCCRALHRTMRRRSPIASSPRRRTILLPDGTNRGLGRCRRRRRRRRRRAVRGRRPCPVRRQVGRT